MSTRFVTGTLAIIAAVGVMTSMAVTAQGQQAAQASNPAAKPAPITKTLDGQPDMQGPWVFTHNIPYETPGTAPTRRRPGETAENAGTSDVAERAVTEARAARRGDNPAASEGGAFYSDQRAARDRKALVFDPPDGRVPVRPEAVKNQQFLMDHFYDSYVYWPSASRCITRGVPHTQLAGGVDSAAQIVQGPGYVSIIYEFMHETRMIPTDGSPHLPKNVKLWTGDSRGRWEGNTLVVDVTNYNDRGSVHNSAAVGHLQGIRQSEDLHVVERFTLVDANTINYEVTIDDPKVYSRPWKAGLTMRKDPSYKLFEYACHEGNYGTTVALRGGRALDKTMVVEPSASRKAAEEAMKQGK